ncbi:MAG: hypothetical protein ACI9OJ_000200 [Myxococcota bacterium]|jgi:hypothetical protein
MDSHSEPSAQADDGQHVIRDLRQADEEMRAAIDALTRARRMRVFEFFRSVNTDPKHRGSEEVHVGHAVTALLNAERLVRGASKRVHDLPVDHETRRTLGPPVRALETRISGLMVSLREQPDPAKLISGLKAARRIVPNRVVRG